MTEPAYEVYALKYAWRDGRRAAHFVGGDPHDVPMPMDYFIWLVRNPERTILVDTGFDAAMAGKRNRTASPRHIIPGHDPLVMQRYPAPSPDLAGIAVRLDVDPVD